MFEKTVLANDIAIGGAFVPKFWKTGTIGSIFIVTLFTRKKYGRGAMLAIEELYPKVRRWTLETPSESYHLHRFYEYLGYVKSAEIKDRKSGLTGYVFKKTVI